MPSPIAYLNGRFLPFEQASLPLHDAGFVSGATVVDNARTFRHQLFRWADHLARFRRDCRDCYIHLDASDEQLTAAAHELIAHNAQFLPPGGELQLITFATPGPLGSYLGAAENGPPTLGMASYPLPPARYQRFFTEGVTLAIAGQQSSDPIDLLPPRVKHRSRLFWHIAAQTLLDPRSEQYRPGAVAVVVSAALGIGDTSIGSILAVEGDRVIAPIPESVQDSISVKYLGELCAGLGLRFETALLDLRRLCREPGGDGISELLLAGTGFCLAGVRELFNSGAARMFNWPGPIYRQIQYAWSAEVGIDIAESPGKR